MEETWGKEDCWITKVWIQEGNMFLFKIYKKERWAICFGFQWFMYKGKHKVLMVLRCIYFSIIEILFLF